jgi:hypothetical protein
MGKEISHGHRDKFTNTCFARMVNHLLVCHNIIHNFVYIIETEITIKPALKITGQPPTATHLNS